MNDETSGTHADTEALEAERRPNATEVDTDNAVDTDKPFDIDPNNPIIKNIEESVERAAW
ncbi:MAG: hypothetical protein IAI49_01615 [Candidatus Eremiobacteraeota bacterium]|nr:hypothetical protein [Candidatus Eremiobacteraeota bacterium]